MNTIIYFIQANLFLSAFFLFYLILLRKETFHLQNRIFLISAVFISLVLPFFQSIFLQKIAEPITDFQSIATVYSYTTEIAVTQNFSQKHSNLEIIKILYWAGVATSILILLIKSVKTLNWVKTCIDKKGIAFSFFSKIFIDKNLDLFEIVQEHEKTHVNQFHFLDILIFEFLKIVFWFNPTVYFYKKAIKIIHEFLADESASRQLFCKSEYATLLVSKQFQIQPSTLFTQHFFNQSTLKTRIEMLLKNRSHKTAMLKYGLLVPILFIMLLISSFTVVKDESLKAVVENLEKNKMPFSEIKTGLIASKVDTLKPANSERIIYNISEQIPEFKGGVSAMYRYLGENIKYPEWARKANIEGKVFVKFVIEDDGKIGEVKITKEAGNGLDEEAIRVIKNMPDWNPGVQNGKPVAVYYNLPIVFKLENTPYQIMAKEMVVVGHKSDSLSGSEKETNGNFSIGVKEYKFSPRKYNKLNNEDYLLFVDGKEILDKKLDEIDPNSIESVSVLKDAETIKAYGSRAKNGVISIVTKKLK